MDNDDRAVMINNAPIRRDNVARVTVINIEYNIPGWRARAKYGHGRREVKKNVKNRK